VGPLPLDGIGDQFSLTGGRPDTESCGTADTIPASHSEAGTKPDRCRLPPDPPIASTYSYVSCI
jgi:hypothetical protein